MTVADLPEGFLTFWIPFEPEVAPNAEDLTAQSAAWAQKVGLGGQDPDRAAVYGNVGALMMAHFFPHTTGRLQQALADYSAWAWAAKDAIDPAAAARTCDVVHFANRMARLTRSPHSWAGTSTPLEDAFTDVITRIRACTSDLQFAWFMRGQEIWLHQLLWENALRERGAPPTVNEYLAMRIGAVGIYSTHGYLPCTENIEPPARELATPLVQATAEAGLLASALDNDRYSSIRDAIVDPAVHSLPAAIRADQPDLTAAQAMQAAVSIRDQILALYLRLRDRVLATASPALRQFFTGIELVIAGNYVLGATALRYLNPAATGTYQRTTTPPTTVDSGQPLPYPTIVWWWQQLTS
jgi:hypothetical protein